MPDARPDAQGVPKWMRDAGIQTGEWLILTKAQLKSQQRPDKPLKVRVWATGMLHTTGYQGELAVTMTKGKKRPLTSADIIRELYNVSVKYFEKIAADEEQMKTLAEGKDTIRRALSDLEDDGVCCRTDAKGTPLASLSAEQLRRLPSGTTKIYFFLQPKQSKDKTVEDHWQEHLNAQVNLKTKVDKNCPRTVSISQILNVFQVGQFSKRQLSNPQLSTAIQHAFEDAQAAFRRRFEVDTACLPVEVVTPRLPKVDTGRLAFESTPESKENHHHPNHPEGETADLMMMTEEQFHEAVCEKFSDAGKPLPGPKATRPVFASLNGNSRRFVDFLTIDRLRPVYSGGVLPHLLQSFLDTEKQEMRKQQKQEAEQSRQQNAERRRSDANVQEMANNARYVLAHPEEHTANEIEWAQEVLKTPSVA